MNIKLQMCGLVITVILFILFKSHKRLNLEGEKTFFKMINITFICIALDVLSVIVIHYRDQLPEMLVKIICKAYPISMIWVGWINLCYIFLDLNSSKAMHQTTVRRTRMGVLIASAIVALVPIKIFKEGTAVYTYGPAIVLTYIFVLAEIIAVLNVALFIKIKKNSRRGAVTMFVMLLWISAAIIQGINNQFLLVGFSMALGVMTLYIVLENPDANLDRSLGCYNSYALHGYIRSLIEDGEKFSLLDISITNEKNLMSLGVKLEEVTKQVIDEIEKIDGIELFKNYTTGISILTKELGKIDDVRNVLQKYVSRFPGSSDCLMLMLIEDANQFESEEEVFRFLTFAKGKNVRRISSVVYISEEMIRQYRETINTEKEINLALEEDRVEVFLQPICAVATGKAVGAEALVRIRKRDGCLLSPARFIPIAEATGQISLLGDRVLEKVCAFIKDTEVLSLGIKAIHVNLSAVQCDDPSTAKRLSDIVKSYDVDPQNICFEITETAVSESQEVLLENMNALIEKGFTFALDDFGKGESNLMYMIEMPVNTVKLDMDMTKAFFANPKARIVIAAVSDMAHNLNLPIVAEGVETRTEAETMQGVGVEYIQGYYYSKPLPMNEFLGYLRVSREHVMAPADKENIPAEVIHAKEEMRRIKLSNKHIILAEDNDLTAELTQEILEDEGYTVDVAEDGTMVLRLLKEAKPGTYSLILMDIGMPFMDGFECTRLIRSLENETLRNIPVIALSAHNAEHYKKEVARANMNGFLMKPLNTDALQELVEE